MIITTDFLFKNNFELASSNIPLITNYYAFYNTCNLTIDNIYGIIQNDAEIYATSGL